MTNATNAFPSAEAIYLNNALGMATPELACHFAVEAANIKMGRTNRFESEYMRITCDAVEMLVRVVGPNPVPVDNVTLWHFLKELRKSIAINFPADLNNITAVDELLEDLGTVVDQTGRQFEMIQHYLGLLSGWNAVVAGIENDQPEHFMTELLTRRLEMLAWVHANNMPEVPERLKDALKKTDHWLAVASNNIAVRAKAQS